MGSKMVLDRVKSSDSVQSAGNKYQGKMAQSMGRIYGPDAESAARVLVRLAVARLKGDTDEMVRADDAHLKEVADDSQVIEARDTLSEAVRAVLMDLRETAEVVYGEAFVRTLGFKGLTPTDPVAVHSLGVLVLDNLGTAEPPEPKKPGLVMDLAQWRSPLSDGLGQLGPAVQAVTDDKREADQTLVAKHEAMDRYDQTFSTTANLLSHLLRAAGEEELAKRVRPSTRKPGQTIEDAQEPGTP